MQEARRPEVRRGPFNADNPLITSAPALPGVAQFQNTLDPQTCGIFWENTIYHAGCGGSRTCSTPPGGMSWGCCDESSCYIPATCEDAGAPDCGGTASSLCPYSPIMKCTFGASSLCVSFIFQTAPDDLSKVTSWGCDETTRTYLIGPPEAIHGSAIQSQQTFLTSSAPSKGTSPQSSAGLSKDAIIVLSTTLPIFGLTVLLFLAVFCFQRRRRRWTQQSKNTNDPAPSTQRVIAEMESAPMRPRGQRYVASGGILSELSSGCLSQELDGREIGETRL